MLAFFLCVFWFWVSNGISWYKESSFFVVQRISWCPRKNIDQPGTNKEDSTHELLQDYYGPRLLITVDLCGCPFVCVCMRLFSTMKTRRAEKERSILAPTLSNSPVCTVCAWARLYRLRLLLLPPKKTRKGGNGHNDMVHISTSRAQSEHSHIPTGFSCIAIKADYWIWSGI